MHAMTRRRLTLSLPEETLRLIDRLATGRSRSQIVDVAVRRYVATVAHEQLREHLKAGARQRARRTLQVVGEWFPLDEEAWSRRLDG